MPKGIYIRKPFTKKHLENMSKSKLGLKHSESHKLRISNAIKKSHASGSRRDIYKKISQSKMGHAVSRETREKISLSLRNENSSLWRGGISKLNLKLFEKIRHSFEYRQWRNDIMTRDGFMCTNCDSKENLHVDHQPKDFSEIIKEYKIKTLENALLCDELFNINNGKTLCYRCHYEKTFGKKMPKHIVKWG